MTTQTTVPVRLGENHLTMLRELRQFWGDNSSEAIRRAIETEHQMMTVSLRGNEAGIREFGLSHFLSVRERYSTALAELRRATLELQAAGQ